MRIRESVEKGSVFAAPFSTATPFPPPPSASFPSSWLQFHGFYCTCRRRFCSSALLLRVLSKNMTTTTRSVTLSFLN